MLGYPESSTYDRPDPGLAPQWKTRMSRLDLGLVEGLTGERLAARGYEPSGVPPLRVGPLRGWWLSLDERLRRHAFRLRRLGPALYGAEVAMRLTAPLLRRLKARRRRTLLRLFDVERR